MQQNKTKHKSTNLRLSCSIPRSPHLLLGIRRSCCVFVRLAHFASGLQIARHVGSLRASAKKMFALYAQYAHSAKNENS